MFLACKDNHVNCQRFSGYGYCAPRNRYQNWMVRNCKKSCKICKTCTQPYYPYQYGRSESSGLNSTQPPPPPNMVDTTKSPSKHPSMPDSYSSSSNEKSDNYVIMSGHDSVTADSKLNNEQLAMSHVMNANKSSNYDSDLMSSTNMNQNTASSSSEYDPVTSMKPPNYHPSKKGKTSRYSSGRRRPKPPMNNGYNNKKPTGNFFFNVSKK